MWVVLLGVAMAAEPGAGKASPDDPVELRLASEPFGQGDDRTAERLEELVRARRDRIEGCFAAGLRAGEDPIRFVSLKVGFKGSGAIKSLEVLTSSRSPVTDACAVAVFDGLVLPEPPMFNDKIRLNVTWAVVKPEPAEAPPTEPAEAAPTQPGTD